MATTNEFDGKLTKVLVANRGEIAVRILRTLREAGLGSVAVYSADDAEARFVRMADEAYSLDGVSATETYLDGAKILDVAVRSGADAVHPGYGFLSENADFAAMVLDAGLTWIGPDPATIRDLGDKMLARGIAEDARAPMAPGSTGPVDGPGALAFAAQHGYPIAIKAAHGGGGRGMKVAHNAGEVPGLLESATREALAAFGRGECFVERYLDRARHVEAQVLADSHGNVIIVGTRDCTLQRRFQKLVEEAPAPFLSEEVRTAIYEGARRICRSTGYVGAGTVEFLVQDDIVSFLEVNTRLQVEHPVSELTTGLDLVREQLRIAAGLPLRQRADPVPRGHAIEFRINGEDPGQGFLPAPGTLTRWIEPSGPGVRVDSGVNEGDTVSGRFDSLLAKLTVWGEDRTHALERARRALAEFAVEGVATVLDFHRSVVDDPRFALDDSWSVYTRWIEDEWLPEQPPSAQLPASGGTADNGARSETFVIEIDSRRHEVRVPAGLLAGRSNSAGEQPRSVRTPPRDRRRGSVKEPRTGVPSNAIAAPMTGVIVEVLATPGQQLPAGGVVLIMEAMKMEHRVVMPRDGVVDSVEVAMAQSVQVGQALCLLAPAQL